MKLQPPSSAVGSERPSPPSSVAEAAETLAANDLLAFVWLDKDLKVVERFGRLADFVPVGQHVADAMLPLFGLEDEITRLQSSDSTSLDIANVSIHTLEGVTPKLNLHVHWLAGQGRFLVSLSRVSLNAELELELSRQVRSRMIAESLVAEKSRELEHANAELMRANRDLAEFAHIISHDLNAPLRALRYSIDSLEQSLGTLDASRHATTLDLVRERSRRMTSMLNALLAYSRIGRKSEAVERIDTEAMLAAILHSFIIPATMQVDVTGTWPVLDTLAAPLDLVLRNLIGNAIEHHDRPEGHIGVHCDATGGMLRISITDDGPGIPLSQQDAIFQPFVRLQPGPASGSGIGLSLVRKTLETVGGELRLVSDPSMRRGSTFTVTWPSAIE